MSARFFRAVIFVAAFLALTVLKASAHAFLESSEPSVGAKVKAPKEIILHFTDDVDPAKSIVKVFAPDGRQIDKRDVKFERADASVMRVSLPALAPGIYKVEWRCTCEYGHVTNSTYTFHVMP